MLRPATPLAIILFIAFVLLLISVISTPVVKGIPLATFQGTDYGVFGFCKGSQCSSIKVGYTADDTNFSLPANTRHSLSAILIVHPVAALLTLICFILAASAHFHSPSHSPRYLLALIILLLPTLLVTLLAFLVDILLFIPHLAWGGWIVLVSTILIVVSGIVTCAMRRTLVSRKARKKRIAENAEMNGDNYYNRQDAHKAEAPPPLTQQPTAPVVNGTTGPDTLPQFATFADSKTRRIEEEDRIPLRSLSGTTPSTVSGARTVISDDGTDRYGGGQSGRGAMGAMGALRGGRGARTYNGPRDEYGNPLPPAPGFGSNAGSRRNSQDQQMRRQYSGETLNSQGSRGRGRGGYPPRGYGRGGLYNGRGGPGMNGNGRGGTHMGALAAGAGAGMVAGEMMGRGQRGPPPGYGNGYGSQGRGGGPGPYGRNESPYGAPGSYGRRQSPGPPSAPGYGRQTSPAPMSGAVPVGAVYDYGSRTQSPGGVNGQRFREQEQPPPMPVPKPSQDSIGQAIEMDATTGSPSLPTGFDGHPIRDSDGDVQGFVGLQQGRMGSPPHQDESLQSPTSLYSNQQQDAYVPARAAWADGPGRNGTPPPKTNPHGLGPVHRSPVELSASGRSPVRIQSRSPVHARSPVSPHSPVHNRMNSSDNYYEDVDPRFSELESPSAAQSAVPTLLLPGGRSAGPTVGQQHNMQPGPDQQHLEPMASYDSIPNVARSDSDGSNLTSISRRGINGEWAGQQQGHPESGYGHAVPMSMGLGGVPNRRPMAPQQRQPHQDVLTSNPDFELPRSH